jgi:acetyl-CoA C-acetyltransferase
MPIKVAVIEVAQLPGGESSDAYLDQVFRVCREVLDKTGLERKDIGTTISATSDIFHSGISCANAYYWDAGAGLFKNGSRNDGESMSSVYYGAMRIASGAFDTALIVGMCKGSENPDNETLTHYFTDPFYQRQMGMNDTIAAGLQMREYMDRYNVTEEQCAQVAVKNLGNAVRNPYAHLRSSVSLEDVMGSAKVADPLKKKEIAPDKSEGFVAMLLASEDVAKKLTDKPVWLKGFSTTIDTFYLGDRDLTKTQLPTVAKRAYEQAGITDPRKELDVVELCEPFAFQELMYCEQLGLCPEGEGAKLLESGATRMGGDIPVNPSGGLLAMNPYATRGLYRFAEVVLQIKGQAGEHQVDRKVTRGLAHGSLGFAGQSQAVAILES